MTVNIDLSDRATKMYEELAASQKLSVSELMRRTILEQLEDEYDRKAGYEALEDLKTNPVTYSHEEVGKMLFGNEIPR